MSASIFVVKFAFLNFGEYCFVGILFLLMRNFLKFYVIFVCCIGDY